MALQYPLLFPYGEDGFYEKISYHINAGSRKTKRGYVIMKEYYAYIIKHRHNQGTTLLRGRRLFQQYLVDAFTDVEEQRLKWTRNNQYTLRVDLYHNLCDAVRRGDMSTVGLGKRIVFPRSFIGNPRYMMQNYQDAMALCRAYGNLDLFITFTFNPKWAEISEMLAHVPGQKSHDRPKIGTQVLKMKLTDLFYDLTKRHIFGDCCAVMQLNYHLPDQNAVTLRDSENLSALLEREALCVARTTETLEARETEEKKCIGRIVYLFPDSGERYYLRMLLNVVRGPRYFKELMTVNKKIYATFKATCFAYGLLNDDKEWTHAIAEAKFWAIRPQLRDLFITILLFCDVRRPLQLWEENWAALSEDILHKKDAINEYMFKKLGGVPVTYNSAYEICKASTDTADQHYMYPDEFLNTLNLPGMPPCPLLKKRTPRNAHTEYESNPGPMQRH
ncbi:ATP-dependent DNA helicase PIF1-like protein [Tanacetum coccineum]